jgi:hypothetical protein
LHASLSRKTNLKMLAVWLLAAIAISVFAGPVPWMLLACGVALGAISGGLQLRVIRQAPDALLASTTLMEVRRAMATTSTGRLYFHVFWGIAILQVALAAYLLGNRFFAGWAASYCAYAFTRDLVAMRGVVELNALWEASQHRG